MNHMNMAGPNAGAALLGGVPLMNNGTNGEASRTGNDQDLEYETRLNTYIYDYFLKKEQYDCARSLLRSGVQIRFGQNKNSPGRRRDGDVNGTDDGAMDTDSKDDLDSKRPEDLPSADIPADQAGTSFLMEWFSTFWDMYFAQRKDKRASANAMQYVQHTQQQTRARQEQQQQLLRQMPQGLPGGMNNYQNLMRLQANGMGGMNQNDLRQKALQNNRNAYGQQPTPQQLAQMKNQQQLLQQQQQHMQREGSDVDINGQRPHTPSSGDNAPSPSKRPRIEGAQYNGQPMMPNGRGQQPPMPQQIINTPAAANASHVLLANGINPNQLSTTQFESFQQQNPQIQARSIAVYNQNLVQHQGRQGMAKPVMPNQGSPMMQPGLEVGSEFYGANPGLQMPLRNGQPTNGTSGNHALQDYQMQLMLLEQQNKKRLLMARQEQDDMRGPDVQPGFPPGISPQGSRSGPSPNPNDQMKRGTPKMGPAGIPGSPMPDGTMPQARGSPAAMNYNQMTPEIYQQMKPMDNGMVGMVPNGNVMRPPSSHPQFGSAQYNPQMEALARAQAQPVGRMTNGGNWQQGPQGQAPMMPQPPQAPQQMGTPQQRAMPPPSAPPAGAATNGRPGSPPPAAAPPTPQQTAKPNPKKKDGKEPRKRPTKNKTAGSAATPSAEADNPPPTPTPSTPITPQNAASFLKTTNGQNQAPIIQASTSAATSVVPLAQPQPDANSAVQFGGLDGSDGNQYNMDFSGLESSDVLENFDFDSFLQSTDDPSFTFDPTLPFGTADGVEAGAGDA